MLNNQQASLDLVFHALADPGRRAMVERLTRGAASVSELAAPMKMSLAAVMQHLQVLEDSRLVRTEKKGRVRTCVVSPDVLAKAEAWLSERRAFWERNFDRLADLLAEDTAKPKANSRKRKRTP
jgi:DNA-binding transcriptional ArsR family regulator